MRASIRQCPICGAPVLDRTSVKGGIYPVDAYLAHRNNGRREWEAAGIARHSCDQPIRDKLAAQQQRLSELAQAEAANDPNNWYQPDYAAERKIIMSIIADYKAALDGGKEWPWQMQETRGGGK